MKTARLIPALLFLSTVLVSMPIHGAEISESQARQIASTFMVPQGNGQRGAPFKGARLARKYMTKNDTPGVYLFDNPSGKGFVLVAGDDNVAHPVLGYGTGDFDSELVPPELDWWISEYALEIGEASQSGPAIDIPDWSEDPLPESVDPLLGDIGWNQGAPYNADCPELNGIRCYTGCVATSTAQVMKYYSWPPTGSGSWSYTWNNETLSRDFSTRTYDWSLMPQRYNSSSSAEQKAEIAKLMSDVGIALSMNYGTSESGAMTSSTVFALKNNFGYDAGVSLHMRTFYGIRLWETLLRQELAAGRPVIYAGQSSEGGHQFVCDGYNKDGYFHFNWGWGGMCNGYFVTTALVPEGVGIGGFASGYNGNQMIITGIQPDCGHDAAWGATFYGMGFSSTDGITYNLQTGVYTMSAGKVTFNLGLAFNTTPIPILEYDKIYDATKVGANPTVANRASGAIMVTNIFNGGIVCDPVKNLNLADGTYYVYPLGKPESAKEWSVIPMGNHQYITINIVDGKVSLVQNTSSTLSLASLSVPPVIPVNKTAYVEGKMTVNGGEYYNTVNVNLVNESDSIVATGSAVLLDIPAGDSAEFAIPINVGLTVEPGSYKVQLYVSSQPLGPALTTTVESQAVSLDEANFPDSIFREVVAKYDTDNNGVLSDSEISKATTLSAMSKGIEDVTGLSHLFKLQQIYLDGNDISSIDLSELSSLLVLGLDNNRLTELDVTNCPKLQYLRFENNEVSSIDLSHNTMLSTLLMDDNPMLALDLSLVESIGTLQAHSEKIVDTDANGVFDLASVPGMDVSHIENLTGGTLEGTNLKFNSGHVTYNYNTGNTAMEPMFVSLSTPMLTGVNDVTGENEETSTVTDLAGRVVYSGDLSTAHLNGGIYIIRTGNEIKTVLVK